MPFLSDQKNWRAPRPPPTLIIFQKSTDQNSEVAILFSGVKKSYSYVFGDDLLPHSPRGGGTTGYKLIPSRNLSWRNKISMKGNARFSSIIKKNNDKINMKKFFSTESKEQH